MNAPVDESVVRVLAAVIQRDGRYLVCLRPRRKRHGGLWEFPGGKLEPGETLHDAAKRELREELAVDAAGCGELLFTHREPGSPFQIEFLSVKIVQEPRPSEHDEHRWATVPQLQELPLAPSDRAFARTLPGAFIPSPSTSAGQAPQGTCSTAIDAFE